jgi:hypothetical protein
MTQQEESHFGLDTTVILQKIKLQQDIGAVTNGEQTHL